MTFAELQDECEDHLRLWGFLNTSPTPDSGKLVNRAYKEMVWEAESHKTTYSTVTVLDQAEYTLPTPEFKTILDVIYNGDKRLYPINESNLRQEDPQWLIRDSSTPVYYWLTGNKTLRLYPPPDTADVTLEIYGTRAPADLIADTDVPDLPYVYHEYIALGAAYKHVRKFAKGDSRDKMNDYFSEYNAKKDQLKGEFQSLGVFRGYKNMMEIEPDRVSF